MKILGEKSLSSKVEKGLQVLFWIIALVDIAFAAISSISLFIEYSSVSMRVNYLPKIILMTVISSIYLLTGIVALFIIKKFINIFKNLKENKVFEKENATYLYQVSKLSIAIACLYTIVFIGAIFILGRYISFEKLSNILIQMILLIFAVGFFVFGIGIKILSEIYVKAMEYKEENDFTI